MLLAVVVAACASDDAIPATTARAAQSGGAVMSTPVRDAPLLTYEVVTRHPTKLGNLRVVVDESGAVRAQRNDVEPADGQAWSAELPAG